MRGHFHPTPDTLQNARAGRTRAWLSAAIAANRKELTNLKLEWPALFKEYSRPEYRAKEIYETTDSIVIELEHPPAGQTTIFEFSTTEAGTPAARANRIVPSQTQHSHLAPAPGLDRARQRDSTIYAARLRALEWWVEQLEGRLQPLSTDGLLEKPQSPTRPKKAPHKAAKKKHPVAKERRPQGFENLPPQKIDLSRYIDPAQLTPRQRDCYSLNKEYRLGPTEIAHRLGLKHHSTVQYHIARATARIKKAGEWAKKAREIARTP